MYIVLGAADPVQDGTGSHAGISLLRTDASGTPAGGTEVLDRATLAGAVSRIEEAEHPRWVWDRTRDWYPELLAAGVAVERCHDLTLCSAILRSSEFTAGTGYAVNAERPVMDDPPPLQALPALPAAPDQDALFDDPAGPSGADLAAATDLLEELRRQLEAVRQATHPGRLSLLLAAESAAALIAAEMQHAGVPWRSDVHEAVLEQQLGPRPAGYQRPQKLEALAAELRTVLGAPALNPDSPQELMRALHRAGIEVKTTRSWELQQVRHPAVDPLLRYKKLSRLHTANGWAWLDAWVDGGRFRPEYVVGGVVSGRWASRGGGALQIPRQIRSAARADSGWKLIVADAAQLEPRVLVALAQDSTMAAAARGKDLYAGIAAQGFGGGDRAKAKGALLGAIYGATTGESGRLLPELTRTYPRAVGYVEAAAKEGARGGVVTTRLGRSCPPPSGRWRQAQHTTSAEEQRRADALARSRGRFTRNFVVQGSAADWAACWLAELRRRLRAMPARAEGRPELVFFLHDEVMVHAPEEAVPAVVEAVEASAAAAKELLFGRIPVEFPVSVAVVESYDQAK